MVKSPYYSYSVATVLTQYGSFACAVDRRKSETGSPRLTGGGTSYSLRGDSLSFLLSEEGGVVATTRHSVVLVWIPSWDLD